jgi:hypothetical protein
MSPPPPIQPHSPLTSMYYHTQMADWLEEDPSHLLTITRETNNGDGEKSSVKFLDINLSTDSSRLLHAIHSHFTSAF